MIWISNAKRKQAPEKGTVFELKESTKHITIHHIIGCGDVWFLSCPFIGGAQYLNTTDFDEAVQKAKEIIRTEIESYNAFLEDNSPNEFTR